MERDLAVTLRPRRFSEMIGQEAFTSLLTKMHDTGRLSAALMFVGPAGCGKTTTAKIVAVSLNCTHAPFGEPCDECLANEEQFEIIEQNAAKFGGKDDLSELTNCLECYPRFGPQRVIILDEAQQLSKAAQNLLLIPFEFAHKCNTFILGTTDPEKIIAPLKSRCMPFTVKALSDQSLIQLMGRAAEQLGVNTTNGKEQDKLVPLLKYLVENDIRSGRVVLKATEKFLAGSTAEESVQLDGATIDYNALSRAVLNGDWDTTRKLLSEAGIGDAENIRIRVGGYLRKVLLGCGFGNRAHVLSRGIIELGAHKAQEDGFQLSIVSAILYGLCQALNGPKGTDEPQTSNRPTPTFVAGAQRK